MARMIPDYVHQDCKSSAENKLFYRFRDELPDEYIVLHSLALAKHERKISSEIDFLILNKRGYLCLEIKGGGVEFKNGIWFFRDRYGDLSSKRESPFQQASSNMYALRRAIENRFGKFSAYSHSISGYFVIFPDIEFKRESPEWDLNRLVDSSNIHRKLSSIIDDQFDYSESEIRRVAERIDLLQLEGNEVKQLVQFLRGDFHFVPSLSVEIENSYRQLLKLTEEQYTVLDQLEENPRVFIHGRAGTGKTVLAVEKIRRAAKDGKRVMYVCFNRLLGEKIKDIFESEHIADYARASNLHAYAREIIESAGLMSSDIKKGQGDFLYTYKYPELFIEAASQVFSEAPFDIIVIDEGQDLRYNNYLTMLDLMVKGGLLNGQWFWFEDEQQNLFNPDISDEEANISKYNPVFCRLTRNCRNTQPVSVFTSLITGIEPQDCLLSEGPKVEHIFYRDKEHQLREIVNIIRRLRSEDVQEQDIVLLTSVSPEKSVIRDTDKIEGVDLLPFDIKIPDKKCIRYSTIHSFKGLESKVIIVTDMEDLKSTDSRSLNYVGLSRAMSWLCVMINERLTKQYEDLAAEFGRILAVHMKKV